MAVPTPSALSRSHNIFDTVLAAAMIAAAVAFLVFILVRTGTGHLTSYEFTVQLPNAAELSLGSDVRLSGVKVGSVSGLSLDPVRYIALIRVSLRDDIRIPVDSVVAVTVPVMGNSYLSVSPGQSVHFVQAGGILSGKIRSKGIFPEHRRPDRAPAS